jgi:four helix bundle protein
MKDNVVRQLSFDFALLIVETYKHLSTKKGEFILSKQMLRSRTSIGANIEEADSSISTEFSAKISIAYKEARENELLNKTSFLFQLPGQKYV